MTIPRGVFPTGLFAIRGAPSGASKDTSTFGAESTSVGLQTAHPSRKWSKDILSSFLLL